MYKVKQYVVGQLLDGTYTVVNSKTREFAQKWAGGIYSYKHIGQAEVSCFNKARSEFRRADAKEFGKWSKKHWDSKKIAGK